MWAFWRRVQYGTGFFVFLMLFAVFTYYSIYYQAPNCFDNIQNEEEGGIDCDGSCVRMCASSVLAPNLLWAESFKIVDGQYNAVAYVENLNKTASTETLNYTFKLMAGDTVIAERSGTTIFPPNGVYPIFEGRILTDENQVPTKTVIELEPVILWQPATIGRNQFKVLDYKLEDTDTRPRLTAKVENAELTNATKVEVVTTIFNSAGKPLTASQTFVDDFTARTTRDVVFTWPGSIAKTVRSCDVPSDIMLVLDRSGSMAADGGNPPEPLNSVKKAAMAFVDQVNKNTKIGFLSYATTPSSPIEQTLVSDLTSTKEAIASVVMGKDGVQYTNMGEAIASAQTELSSERHRSDARKVIIFMTDGDVTRPVNPETGLADRQYAADFANEKATQAKEQNTLIYSIGFGDFLSETSDSVVRDVSLIQGLASGPEYYFSAPTIKELEQVYKNIAVGICEEGPARVDVLTKTKTNFTPLR
jgi:Mg-chelatase subunit ChlD